MELNIICIGPSSVDSVTYIVAKISQDKYLVFSPIKKSTTVDDFNPDDFGLSDAIDFNIKIMGPTDAFNKTKNKEVNICIHDVGITADEIKQKYSITVR